jgi:hypothetical protein
MEEMAATPEYVSMGLADCRDGAGAVVDESACN